LIDHRQVRKAERGCGYPNSKGQASFFRISSPVSRARLLGSQVHAKAVASDKAALFQVSVHERRTSFIVEGNSKISAGASIYELFSTDSTGFGTCCLRLGARGKRPRDLNSLLNIMPNGNNRNELRETASRH
jgi:hypothetical protein